MPDVTEQVTEQVMHKSNAEMPALDRLSTVQWLIVKHANTPRRLNELLDITGFKQRPYFKAHHLQPLLAGGVLKMTVPDKPTSSRQQYVLTQMGMGLRDIQLQGEANDGSGTDEFSDIKIQIKSTN